jgi:hypothetical protein
MATTIPTPQDKLESSLDDSRWCVSEDVEWKPEDEERLELVRRIANSEAFQKSTRLPGLLSYLAHCTLTHNRAGLTEQAIAQAVFGKAKDFNPTEDSLVRVYMRQLRLRLHEYFHSVGRDEPIVIEVPKGGYVLAFHSQHQSIALPEHRSVASITAAETLSPSAPKRYRLSALLPWALFAVALVFAGAGWMRHLPPAVRDLPPWPIDQVIEPGRQTTMVQADGSYVLRLLGDQEITLDQYADHHYSDKLIPTTATPGERRLFGYLQASRITSMADVRAASAITALAGSLRPNIVIRSAKELNGTMLTSGNFILVGAKTSNPWAEMYEDRLNFRLVEEGIMGGRYIQNRSPKPGEHSSYTLTGPTGFSGDDYATLSLVPGMGEQGSVLLIQGLRLEGTEAAIRFLASDDSRKLLAEKLRSANSGKLPHYFEALLHSHSVGGSAVSVDCIAVRAVPPTRH